MKKPYISTADGQMTANLSDKQMNMLKTIKRHGGARIMTALDSRVSKALLRKGLLSASDGYFNLTVQAKALIEQSS
jgi:hypothetical protein